MKATIPTTEDIANTAVDECVLDIGAEAAEVAEESVVVYCWRNASLDQREKIRDVIAPIVRSLHGV